MTKLMFVRACACLLAAVALTAAADSLESQTGPAHPVHVVADNPWGPGPQS
ncbi:hypothetical protein [Kitasatospora sp. NPDC093679]|uniref:hypothetical protein n=1 Tax=unclassified Kitasatospora TaxID=2633591 RepID=UPI00342E5348